MSARNPISAEMAVRVEARAGELRHKAFSELVSLPEWDTVNLDLSGEPVHLTVFRATRADDEVLVVVQAARERFLGIFTEIRVVGFLARPSGERAEAPEELLWDYK